MVSVKVGHADLALASSFDVESMVAHPNYEKNHNRSVLLLGQLFFDRKIIIFIDFIL